MLDTQYYRFDVIRLLPNKKLWNLTLITSFDLDVFKMNNSNGLQYFNAVQVRFALHFRPICKCDPQ